MWGEIKEGDDGRPSVVFVWCIFCAAEIALAYCPKKQLHSPRPGDKIYSLGHPSVESVIEV